MDNFSSKYEIIRALDQGGMCDVFLARQLLFDRIVAIKVLKRSLSRSEDCRKRFVREAKNCAKLNHNSIVTIFEIGDYNDKPFISMQYLEGGNYDNWLINGGKLIDGLSILLSVSKALLCAHEDKILHRDLKPDNILLDSEGKAKVADWGLAKTMDNAQEITHAGVVIGTPEYMSPEQIMSKPLSQASDLYSFGIILYETISGCLPFPNTTMTDILQAHLYKKPRPIKELAPFISPDLERLVEFLIQKEPTDRLPSAEIVVYELERIIKEEANHYNDIFVKRKPEEVRTPSAHELASLTIQKQGKTKNDNNDKQVNENGQQSNRETSKNINVKKDKSSNDGKKSRTTQRSVKQGDKGRKNRTTVVLKKGKNRFMFPALMLLMLCLAVFYWPELKKELPVLLDIEVEFFNKQMLPAPDSYFNDQQIIKGTSYSHTKITMWLISLAVTAGTLLFFIATKVGLRLRVALAMKANGKQWAMVLLMSTAVFISLKIVKIPIAFYSSFTIPHRFELSNQSLYSWITDYIISSFIDGTILIVSIVVLYKLLASFKKYWWVISAFFISGGTVFLFWAAPLLISPMFNTFTPLENKPLKQQIFNIAEKANVPVNEILVIDASKRTKALNAYYSGVFNTKRIVIYDNLLKNLKNEEILSIIAHELGHWQHKHIIKGLLLACLGIFFSLYLLSLVLSWSCRHNYFGIHEPSDPGSIPLFLLLIFFIQIAVIPAESITSRIYEREADKSALKLTLDPESFISIEQKLAISNLADVQPPHWFVFLTYSHPPVLKRIQMAIDFKNEKGSSQNETKTNESTNQTNLKNKI